MKKLILILALMISGFSFGQVIQHNQTVQLNVVSDAYDEADSILVRASTGEMRMRPVSSLPTATGPAGEYNEAFMFLFSTSTTSPASSQQIRLNNSDPSLATEVYISNGNKHGGNISSLVDTWSSGSGFYMQQAGSTNIYAIYTVNGTATNSGGSYTVPVTYQGSNGTFGSGEDIHVVVNPNGALDLATDYVWTGNHDFNGTIDVPTATALTEAVNLQQLTDSINALDGTVAIGKFDEGKGETYYPVGDDRTEKGWGGFRALDMSTVDQYNVQTDSLGAMGAQGVSMGTNISNRGFGSVVFGDNNSTTADTFSAFQFLSGLYLTSNAYNVNNLGIFNTANANYVNQIGHSNTVTSGGGTTQIGLGLSDTTGSSDEMTMLGSGNVEPSSSLYFSNNNIGFILGAGRLGGAGNVKFTRDYPRNALIVYREGGPVNLAGMISMPTMTIDSTNYWNSQGYSRIPATVEWVEAQGYGTGAGDMLKSVYDTGDNGIVDNAELVNSLTVETAVPVGAVFTDDQNASEVPFTPTGNTTSSDVQAAIEEIQTELDGVNGTTNLAYTASPTNGIVTSDTGTDATITLANGTNAGLMSPGDFNKLAGIEGGATADQVASEVPYTPTGNTTSTDVQAAITELQTEIDGLGTGNVSGSGTAEQIAIWDGANSVTGDARLTLTSVDLEIDEDVTMTSGNFYLNQEDSYLGLDTGVSHPRFGFMKKSGFAGMFAHSNNSDFIIGMTDAVSINPADVTTVTQRVLIDNTTGFMQVGGGSPIERLDVEGNIHADNSVYADDDLIAEGAILGGIRSHAGGSAYTTNGTENGEHITMTGATPVVTLDDAAVTVGDQFTIYNKSGEDLTWAFGVGDGAYQGSLPNLPDGSYAWATLESANNWSVVVGGTAGTGGGATTLSALTDTDITSPANGEVLTYNSSSGNWENQSVAGSGDMLKSTYDTDADDIVDDAEALGGVAPANYARTDVAETFSSTISATNLSGTNTGDQTITLTGDVTGSGTGSFATAIASGVVGATELNVTGNGTATQYLRSDGDGSFTWDTPAGGGGVTEGQDPVNWTGVHDFANDVTFDLLSTVQIEGTELHIGSSATSAPQIRFEHNTSANGGFIQASVNDMTFISNGKSFAMSSANSQLETAWDPTTGDGLGNRDYNDGRYSNGSAGAGGEIVRTAGFGSNTSGTDFTYNGITMEIDQDQSGSNRQIIIDNASNVGQAGISLNGGSNTMTISGYGTSASNSANSNKLILSNGTANGGGATQIIAVGDRYEFNNAAFDMAGNQLRNYIIEMTSSTTGETLDANDLYNWKTYNNSSSITVSLPDTFSEPRGSWFAVYRRGAGQVTIDPTGTATINGSGSGYILSTQYTGVKFIHIDTDSDDWYAVPLN